MKKYIEISSSNESLKELNEKLIADNESLKELNEKLNEKLIAETVTLPINMTLILIHGNEIALQRLPEIMQIG